ncbi:MAG: RNA polymerase factor sigma-54 [Bacteroidia bacterium]
MKQSQQQNQKQLQKQGYYLSQQHLKLMHLMHLSGFALQEFLSIELEQNPALEVEKDSDSEETDANEIDDVFDSELFENDDDLFEKKYNQSTSTEEYYEAPVVQYTSLQEKLKEQIRGRALTKNISDIACYLIDELDDDGYLRMSLNDVCDDYGFAHGKIFEESIFEEALAAVQSCEPAGIAARDLRECLLLQLIRKNSLAANQNFNNALLILENHYQLFAQHGFNKLKETLNISEGDWKNIMQIILHLNPKPVTETNKYELMREQIIPDFEVTVEDEEIYVSLTQTDSTKLKVNPDFEKSALHVHSDSEKKQAENYFSHLIEDAQILVDALKERESTMMKVMSVIAAMQTTFFRTGDMMDLKPMILMDIAGKTGYDVSTVSRITSNKYVQTSHGIFPLKNLFMRNINPDGEQNSQNTAMVIQKEIKNIINAENKNAPLSDSDVVKCLQEKGMTIARRTVVKYREAIGIPNSVLRKQ